MTLVAALLPLLLGAAAADAKKKKKKPASPPVTVVSATGSTSADNEPVTVTAACPSGLLAVGGGFDSPVLLSGGAPTDVNLVYESRRTGQRSWQVSAVRENSGGPGPSLPTIAYADCRSSKLSSKKPGKKASAAKKKAKKKLRITELSGSATSAATPGSQVTANASCPTGTKALGGGFSSSPAPNLGSGSVSYPIFWASYRTSSSDWFGDDRGWGRRHDRDELRLLRDRTQDLRDQRDRHPPRVRGNDVRLRKRHQPLLPEAPVAARWRLQQHAGDRGLGDRSPGILQAGRAQLAVQCDQFELGLGLPHLPRLLRLAGTDRRLPCRR